MNRRELLLGAVGAMSLGGGEAGAADGFKPLYNGTDLTGWQVRQGNIKSWEALPDRISCPRAGGGCLFTEKEYGDFELRLEYRIPPGGNTGVGIRVPPGGWPSTDGFEIQILDDQHPRYGGKIKPEDGHGSIYRHAAPTSRPFKPAGEWNSMTVFCRGARVRISINGVEIHNVNLDDFNNSLGKGTIPLGKRPRRGQIGLPSHGDPVDFRKLEIREL